MRFKKIYIEITNRCNLSCDFCIKNRRQIIDMNFDNFKIIINKIKPYTKEIYLHVLGEPLIHRDINSFINYATSEGLLVNITTNGYFVQKIINNKNIHRLNISLHSFDDKYKVSLKDYLDNIFNTIDKIDHRTFISLRLWIKDNYTLDILKYINNRYNKNIHQIQDNHKIMLRKNLIIDSYHMFTWPDLNNKYYSEVGKCYGLITHIGILSDGTVIPCCLDTRGIIKLGNIYNDDLEEILNKEQVKEMISGFKNNQKIHELCKHCCFLEVKNESVRLEK